VQPLMNLASEGDVLITLSGLGNSANIRRAIEWANLLPHRLDDVHAGIHRSGRYFA
jgi:hypothetical protein